MTLPPLNGLKAFEAAGRHLNFRLAAEELGVSQGAVAQQVRGLEGVLGVKLFERRSKGISLTAAGRGYHRRVAQAFDTLREATDLLRPDPATVLISATPSFASKWLIPNLPRFTQAAPDVDLRIIATEQVSSFHADGIDLAIRHGEPPFGASIQAWRLFGNEVVAVAAPSLAAGGAGFAALPKLHDTHDLWPRYLAAHGLRDDSGRAMRFSLTVLAIDAAIAGQGVALASRVLVEREIRAGRLVEIGPGSLTVPGDFHLLAQRPGRRLPAVDKVIGWLRSEAGEGRA